MLEKKLDVELRMVRRALDVLVLVPNVIGYARIALLFLAASFLHTSNHLFFIGCYIFSVVLDGVDGWMARRLQQTSAFGAWLDVVVDNFGRQFLWTHLFAEWGWIIGAWEWLVFASTHRLGPAWKSSAKSQDSTLPPTFVRFTMQKGFKSPLGLWTIGGLHGLPIWLFILRDWPSSLWSSLLTFPLISGRIWCFLVELWFVTSHICDLLHADLSPSN